MAVKGEKSGFVALSRFGFGSRAEIEDPGMALLAGPGLPDSLAVKPMKGVVAA